MNGAINIKRPLTLVLILFFATFTLYAQKKLPVPAGNSNQLFYLQRTPNTNTIVVYELNYNNSFEEPGHVYWIRYSEQGQQEELNFIQRKFAYGVKST